MANFTNPVMVTSLRRDGEGGSPLEDKTEAVTPDHMPNVIVQVVTPFASILIRSLRVFIQTLLATSGLGTAGLVVNLDVLSHIHMREVLIISGTTAVVCALQNVLELLGKLDQKYPLLRGA